MKLLVGDLVVLNGDRYVTKYEVVCASGERIKVKSPITKRYKWLKIEEIASRFSPEPELEDIEEEEIAQLNGEIPAEKFSVGDRILVPFLGEKLPGTILEWDADFQSWGVNVDGQGERVFWYQSRDLCLGTANYSEESADSAVLSSNGSAVQSKLLDTVTSMRERSQSTSLTSQMSPSTGISEASIQSRESTTCLLSPSLAQELVTQANGRGLITQTLPSGEKGYELSARLSPSMPFGNNLWELSTEVYESCLEELELVAIDLNLEKFQLPALEQDTTDGDYLSFPTLTSNAGASGRSSGQNKLETWFKDSGLIPNGQQLSAQAMCLIQGFPANWCDVISPYSPGNLELNPEPQEDLKPESSLAEQSLHHKQQSPSEGFCTLKVSEQLVPLNEEVIGHHFWYDELDIAVTAVSVRNWRESPRGEIVRAATVEPWWGSLDTSVIPLKNLELIESFSCEIKLPAPSHSLKVQTSSKSDEHYTPDVVIEAAIATMKAIDLDPCSNSHEHPNIPAANHYTIKDDGLSQSWAIGEGRIYLNPPYSKTAEWVDKLLEEYEAGGVREAVVLVKSATDTKWYQKLDQFHKCHWNGRLKFKGNDSPAPFASTVFYIGQNFEKFQEAFTKHGRVHPGGSTPPRREEGMAISLHQPWATLIAQGRKQWETRSWSTKYRGKFLICAARLQPSKVSLQKFGLSQEECPLGVAIAICDLVDCVPITQELIDQQSEEELKAGEWKVGRYAWRLENVVPVEPKPTLGGQKLWRINPSNFVPLVKPEVESSSSRTELGKRKRGRAQKKASGSLSKLCKSVKDKVYYSFQYNYDIRDFSKKRGWRTVKVGVPKLKSHLVADAIREGLGIKEVLSLLGRVPAGEIRE